MLITNNNGSCVTCQHNNVCKFKDEYMKFYNEMTNNIKDKPECATIDVHCKYVFYSGISASCASRGSNMIQGVVDVASSIPTTTGTPYTINTSSQCKIS